MEEEDFILWSYWEGWTFEKVKRKFLFWFFGIFLKDFREMLDILLKIERFVMTEILILSN